MKLKKNLTSMISMTTAAALLLLPGLAQPAAFVPAAAIEEYVEPEILTANGLKYFVEDGAVHITGYTDDIPAELVIPSEIDGLPVKYLSQMAFYNCEKLTAVTIPETVTSFGFQNFLSCKNLKTVNLPDGLTGIYEAAFAQCTSLESITLPDGMKEIGNLVFSGCTSLKEINIPASVDTYGEPAFGETPWLAAKKAENPTVIVNNIVISGENAEHVTIPDGVTAIAPFAFGWQGEEECIMTEIDLPDSLTNLMYGAFSGCTKLETIHYGENLTEIGRAAFDSTAWLEAQKAKDPLVVLNGVLIDAEAAEGDVTIPETVKIIGEGAFVPMVHEQDGAGIRSVVIPDTVTEIRNRAFDDCSRLTEVSIPASVRNIGRDAFAGCEKLATVTIENPSCTIYDSDSTFSNTWDGFTGTIKGYTPSTAQAYAEKYSYKFESLGEAPQQTLLGDVSLDGTVNASDAAQILIAAASMGAGGASGLTAEQEAAAEVNGDTIINASDAAVVLIYSAAIGAGQDVKIEDFVH